MGKERKGEAKGSEGRRAAGAAAAKGRGKEDEGAKETVRSVCVCVCDWSNKNRFTGRGGGERASVVWLGPLLREILA